MTGHPDGLTEQDGVVYSPQGVPLARLTDGSVQDLRVVPPRLIEEREAIRFRLNARLRQAREESRRLRNPRGLGELENS